MPSLSLRFILKFANLAAGAGGQSRRSRHTIQQQPPPAHPVRGSFRGIDAALTGGMCQSTASAGDKEEKSNTHSDEEYSDEESVYSDDEPLLAESGQKHFKYEHIPDRMC